MKISGFQKLTLLDFPGYTAAIIFTQGCNYKCSFCHNSDLIYNAKETVYNEDEIIEYLIKRKNLLDGLVISGGEPTMQKDLISFIRKIKNLGFLVKLDTNGSNPDCLKKIIDEKLVDYIAMDIKTSISNYENITKVKSNTLRVLESMELIKKSGIDHEFRTTIMKNYHDLNIIKNILELVGKDEKYFLQNFKDSEYVIDKTLMSFTDEELKMIEETFKKEYSNLIVRGL